MTVTTEPRAPYDRELKEAGQETSPTWELELFLSGALVFAMLQLPDLVDRFFQGVEPHVAGATRTIVIDLGLYAKAIAYTLLITFSVHLIGRAQWVALMGLQSVYPAGIRWDEMKLGPVSREMFRARTPALSATIAKLDNFCSVFFSVGMLFVLMFFYSAMLVGVLGALAWGLSRLLTHGENTEIFFFGLAVLFVAIPVSATVIDRRYGPRLVPGSRGEKALRRLVSFTYSLNLMRATGPMLWTLSSNAGRKKSTAILYVGIVGIILLAAADRLARDGALSLNSYDFYGRSRLHGISSDFYENQRTATASVRAPMIQSDIVRDPYVRLFIPYSPPRHNAVMARECPGLKPLQSEGFQIGIDQPVADSLALPALECLRRIHAVKLDGAAVPGLDFAFYEHPTLGLRGILGYIAIDSLPRGRHVITVMPVPPAVLPKDSAALANAAWKQPYVIPFWK